MAMCTCIRCRGGGKQFTGRGPWLPAVETCALCGGTGLLQDVHPECAALIERLYPTYRIEGRDEQEEIRRREELLLYQFSAYLKEKIGIEVRMFIDEQGAAHCILHDGTDECLMPAEPALLSR